MFDKDMMDLDIESERQKRIDEYQSLMKELDITDEAVRRLTSQGDKMKDEIERLTKQNEWTATTKDELERQVHELQTNLSTLGSLYNEECLRRTQLDMKVRELLAANGETIQAGSKSVEYFHEVVTTGQGQIADLQHKLGHLFLNIAELHLLGPH